MVCRYLTPTYLCYACKTIVYLAVQRTLAYIASTIQRSLTIGLCINVLAAGLQFDWTADENLLLFVCSSATKSKPVKIGANSIKLYGFVNYGFVVKAKY